MIYQYQGFTGAVMTVKGTSTCNPDRTDRETVHSRLSLSGWNDIPSSASTYANCYLDLYLDRQDITGWNGVRTSPLSYAGGKNIAASWDNQASAFVVT